MMDKYQFAIEEIGLSGAVSLGKCSESTLRRWGRKINQRLAWEKCESRRSGMGISSRGSIRKPVKTILRRRSSFATGPFLAGGAFPFVWQKKKLGVVRDGGR